jgi:hypothetical protein
VLAAAAALLGPACSAEVSQPVAYSHAVHVERLGLACDHCHETSTHGEVAGLPPLATCAACHAEPNGTSAEEAKVVEAVRAGRALAWARLYEVPRHVYFTHRRHVAVAQIPCARCHGEMGARTRPPPGPLVPVTMDGCLGCHRERGASVDCDACHR